MNHTDDVRLLVILGPTASGKTELAVELARRINGAIISADSRQVYRGMDLGTGKDLNVYGDVPYYLIDIVAAGERYNVKRYREDVQHALGLISNQGKQPILCGGTGLYIQSVLQGFNYSSVPVNPELRNTLATLSLDALREHLDQLPLPRGFMPDTSTAKRLVRAIEIASWCLHTPPPLPASTSIKATIFGLNPPVSIRRQRITERLSQRLKAGLLEEVKHLLGSGIPAERLLYYGLEYKYATQYLQGQLDYEVFLARLNTEIHRFAKRQMTYFRKMEKDGLNIHWLSGDTLESQCEEVLRIF